MGLDFVQYDMTTFYTSSMFPCSQLLVSKDELCALSGYKQPVRIREWLIKHAIPFVMGRPSDPWPRVFRRAFYGAGNSLKPPETEITLDFSFMHREPK